MQNKDFYERAKLAVTAFTNHDIYTDIVGGSSPVSFGTTPKLGMNGILVLNDLWTPPHDLNGTR